MRYLVLLADEGPPAPQVGIAAAGPAALAVRGFEQAVRRRGSVAGGPLAGPEAATTLRLVDGVPTLVDEPLAVTSARLRACYLIEVDDLDVAVHVSRRLLPGFAAEIRPVLAAGGC